MQKSARVWKRERFNDLIRRHQAKPGPILKFIDNAFGNNGNYVPVFVHDTFPQSALTLSNSTVSVQCINELIRATGEYSRQGDRIRLHRVQGRFFISKTDVFNGALSSGRILVYFHKNKGMIMPDDLLTDQYNTLPVNTQFAGTCLSFPNPYLMNDVIILYDKTIALPESVKNHNQFPAIPNPGAGVAFVQDEYPGAIVTTMKEAVFEFDIDLAPLHLYTDYNAASSPAVVQDIDAGLLCITTYSDVGSPGSEGWALFGNTRVTFEDA